MDSPAPPSIDDEQAAIESPPLERLAVPRPSHAWVNGAFAGVFLYLFLSAINVMGAGLKAAGKSGDWLEMLLAHGDNPFIALMASVFITAIIQSSSFTTSLIITLVATTDMDGEPIMKIETAVYAVMGANIGTSVTNIIASLGSIRIRRQFRRAFTAALVHDIFNWLTVAVLFPLEWITSALSSDGLGVFTRFATWVTDLLGLEAIPKPNSPIKVVTAPIVSLVEWIGGLAPGGAGAQGVTVAVIGLLMLLCSLTLMVKNLKGALLRRVEGLFRRVFFRNDLTAYIIGALTTVMVQSSSITTSLIVPLAGAGAVKIKRVFPYTLGANLGTTITGVIAATANPVAAAVTVAISHVTFNLVGTAIWYPLRRVPLSVSRWYGRLASRSRRYAFAFLFLVFLVIPGLGIIVTEIITYFGSGS